MGNEAWAKILSASNGGKNPWPFPPMTPTGLYAIAVLRIAIGLVFVFAAPASRAPRTLRVFGLVVIIAGLMTPWFGVTRAQATLNWVASAST
jgi:uncharacterized membrane protein YwaF